MSTPPPLGTNIQINEIMFDPSGSEPANEWVELYNPTDTPIAIASWLFEDNIAIFRIPESTTIPAKGYFVLGYSVTSAGGNVDLIYGASVPSLNLSNSGDTVTLRTDTQLIDQIGYNTNWGGAEPKSLSRKFSGKSSQDYTNWGSSQASGGTPRAVNDVDTLPPLITHTPPSRVAWHRDVGVHSTVTDNVDKDIATESVKTRYRIPPNTTYSEITMSRIAGSTWDGVIPGSDVDTPMLEYYIEAKDASNNIGRFAAPDTPQQVSVVQIDTKLVINEIMYDPAGAEPNEEWVELYNYGITNLDLSGWRFGDGEDIFVIPNGTTIFADGYLVLKRSDSAAQGAPGTGINYGDSAPGIQFQNILGEITDQAIISDPTGLIVDEVNYSSTWGASNVRGPNNLTLERIYPQGSSNNSSNWLYSYQQNGTTGETNTSKMVRNVSIEPSYINPLIGETSVITFDVLVDTEPGDNTAVIKVIIRNYSGTAIRTVTLDEASAPGIYSRTFVWDGTNDAGETRLDVFRVEVKVQDKKGEVSIQKVDDRMLLGFNDRYSVNDLYIGSRQKALTYYFTARPVLMSITINDAETNVVRHLLDSEAVGAGNQVAVWDGRRDNGSFHLEGTTWSFQGQGFPFNALIALPRYQIAGETLTPKTYFNPDIGESVTLWYFHGDSGLVSITVRRAKDGMLIRTLATNMPHDFGEYSLNWDGKDNAEAIVPSGKYLIVLDGVTSDVWQKSRLLEEIEVRR